MSTALTIPMKPGTNAEIVHSAMIASGCFLSKHEIKDKVGELMTASSIAPTLSTLRAHGLVEWRKTGARTFKFLAHSQDNPITPQSSIVKSYTKNTETRVVEEPYHKAITKRTSAVILDEMLTLQAELVDVIEREVNEAQQGCVEQFQEFINSKRG